MKNRYTISLQAINALRVMQRISGLIARCQISVEHMSFFTLNEKNNSCFNFVVNAEDRSLNLLVKQLHRISDLREIKVS